MQIKKGNFIAECSCFEGICPLSMAWAWPQGIGLREHDCSRHSPDRERVARPQACPPPGTPFGPAREPAQVQCREGIRQQKMTCGSSNGSGRERGKGRRRLTPLSDLWQQVQGEGNRGRGSPPFELWMETLGATIFQIGQTASAWAILVAILE